MPQYKCIVCGQTADRERACPKCNSEMVAIGKKNEAPKAPEPKMMSNKSGLPKKGKKGGKK